MLYNYQLTLPLVYNSYDFNSVNPDSQMRMGLDHDILLKEKGAAIVGDGDGNAVPVHESEWDISISSEQEDDSPVPKREFLLKISGILAHSQEEACTAVAAVIHRSCRSLSVLLNSSNYNRHLFQPRVEPQHSKARWERKAFEEPRKEDRQREYVDENGVRHIEIIEQAQIAIGVSCETILFGKIKSVDFSKYFYVDDDTVNYLLDEYYMALGQENIKSKFFHLFSMIEFIEREYKNLSGASPVYDEEDVIKVKGALKNAFSEENREKFDRLEAMVVQRMASAANLGREQKLVNILREMGIKELKDGDQTIPVDRFFISELVKKRNTYFHGSRPSEGKHISVEKAVTWLMYLCPAIISAIADGF